MTELAEPFPGFVAGGVEAPVQAAAEWIERYRAFWDSRFDALADCLAKTTKEEQPRPTPSRGFLART